MSAIGIRRSGIEVKCQIPAGKVNDTYVDIFEIELMAAGTTGIDGQTLQEFASASGSDTEIWNSLVTAGKTVSKVTKRNIQLITAQISGVTENQGKFIGENIAEVTAMSRIARFIILSTNAYSIFWDGSDSSPAYDDATGTALTKLIGYGFYFVRVKNVGLEDTGLPSGWKYSKLISFDDFYPTDFGSGLKGHAFVRNVSGTLYFRDNNGNNAVGGSIVIEEGRKLWVGGSSTSSMLGDASNYVGNEIMFVRAGKSHGNPSLRYGYGYSYSGGLDFHAHKITIANGANLIALDQTASYWTVSGDGYYISIIIINTAKTGTAVSGGIKWTKVTPDVNSIVTAGVKAYTNKNGVLQLQTIGAGLTATADAAANSGMDGNGSFKNLGGTERLGVAMIAYKSSFTDQDIQNVFEYLKRRVTL